MKRKTLYVVLCIVTMFFTGCVQRHQPLQGYIEGNYTYISPAVGGKLMQIDVVRGDTVKRMTYYLY